jgi:Spy/CpxP family protein refolding chaperone
MRFPIIISQETAMRFTMQYAIAAAFLAATCATAVAQDTSKPGNGGIRIGDGSFICDTLDRNKVLHDELKLTDEQIGKLNDALKPIHEKRQEAMKDFNPGDLTEDKWKELVEALAQLNAEAKKAVAEVLKPAQLKRLRQIAYQLGGVGSFADKDVQTELKLTDAQMKKVQDLLDAYQKDAHEIQRVNALGLQRGLTREQLQEFKKKYEEGQKAIAAQAKTTEEAVLKVLTDDQKKAWADLQGEKFDLSKLGGPRQGK